MKTFEFQIPWNKQGLIDNQSSIVPVMACQLLSDKPLLTKMCEMLLSHIVLHFKCMGVIVIFYTETAMMTFNLSVQSSAVITWSFYHYNIYSNVMTVAEYK